MAVSAASAVQAVAAARLALAETLLLKPGQVIEAVVVGKTPAGMTTLKIGDQLVQAQLPQSLPVGTTLQLAVKTGGATPQLVVVSQTPPGQAPVAMPQPVVVTPLPLPPEAVVVAQARPEVATAVVPPRLPAANGESAQPVVGRISFGESGLVVAPQSVVRASGASPVVQVSAPAGAQATASQGPAVVTQTASGAVSQSVAAPAATEQIASARASATPIAAQTPTAALAAEPANVSAVARPAVVTASAPLPVTSAAETVPVRAGQVPIVQGQPSGVQPQTMVTAQAAPPAVAPATPTLVPRSIAVAATAVSLAEPEAGNPLLVAQAAVRSPATIADLPRAAVQLAAMAPAVAATPQLPATPQAALAQMVPEALARQDSIGPLLNSLAAVVQKANALPEPVLRAALGVLAQRIVATDGKVVAAELERAVAKSGVYLEASLARALPAAGDAKSGLLALRDALGKWLGEAPVVPAVREAPPPLKGLPLRAPAAVLPPLPDAARDVARALHGQADAAVSRTKLMQMASLPDADGTRPANNPVRMELPFLIGHELVMAQIQIAREGSRREAERKRGWTMRFALNFSATGEVGAEVGLLGKAVNVALWAVEPETAEAMQAALPELGMALEALGLDPGAIRIRQGAPEPEKPVSGRLLDSVS